ncbi:MAG: S8 family serine peptidase [Verrucomicrobiae bacterium]|nr:S8 family serine peptidase [Verrucomicrobiae bacterium]
MVTAIWLALVFGADAGTALSSYHPERILVLPRDASRLDALAQLHAAHQHRVVRSLPEPSHVQVVQLADGETVPVAVARYQASGLVLFAEPDYAVSAASTLPNDPRFQDGTQWWLNNYGQNGGLPDADIDAPEAWDIVRNASNVIVAIVDSGIRHTHEDLAANLWTNPLDGTHGFNALTGNHDPWDDNGHGSHLAGIIGAVTDNAKGVAGLAWRVRLMACKFLDAAGNGFNSDAMASIEFARTNGAHIINLSWGGSEFSAIVSNVIWSARADGILFTAAAGNNAQNTDVLPFYPASLALDNLVAVGASTRTDASWSFSNYGATNVALFAPGAAIYSTGFTNDFHYASRNGTSMAAAVVAGALALLREQHPQAPAPQLIERLLTSVDALPAFAGRCRSGGRLNVRKAVDRPAIAVIPEVWPVQLRITGVPGHRYLLTASTNLNAWTALRTNFADFNGDWVYEDHTSTNTPLRFYQALPGP